MAEIEVRRNCLSDGFRLDISDAAAGYEKSVIPCAKLRMQFFIWVASEHDYESKCRKCYFISIMQEVQILTKLSH